MVVVSLLLPSRVPPVAAGKMLLVVMRDTKLLPPLSTTDVITTTTWLPLVISGVVVAAGAAVVVCAAVAAVASGVEVVSAVVGFDTSCGVDDDGVGVALVASSGVVVVGVSMEEASAGVVDVCAAAEDVCWTDCWAVLLVTGTEVVACFVTAVAAVTGLTSLCRISSSTLLAATVVVATRRSRTLARLVGTSILESLRSRITKTRLTKEKKYCCLVRCAARRLVTQRGRSKCLNERLRRR